MSWKIWSLKKSPWVFHVNTGACNNCDIEIVDLLTPKFDVERFGIKLVGSPRHADALLVTGGVTAQAAPRLRSSASVPAPVTKAYSPPAIIWLGL
jgi:membrane-bound hydrogenase subunit mbhJ